MRSSLSSTALNEISFIRLAISRADARRLAALGGVDLDEEGVARRALADQRRQRRVAAEAAVPVGLAVDLDRLEHRRQAGRGEEHVRGDLVLAEHPAAAGADVGRGDEELDRAGRQPLEVDDLGEDVGERVAPPPPTA